MEDLRLCSESVPAPLKKAQGHKCGQGRARRLREGEHLARVAAVLGAGVALVAGPCRYCRE